MSAEDAAAERERLDAALVTDVRQWRNNPSNVLKLRVSGRVDLDLEELDALLRTIDRLERVKRELVDMPDDPGFHPKRVRADVLPAGHALIDGEVVPLPQPFDPAGTVGLYPGGPARTPADLRVVQRDGRPTYGASRCTCPSGDGSLRWPCSIHPARRPNA